MCCGPLLDGYLLNWLKRGVIRASVDALCRDDTSEISRDLRRKHLETRQESLLRPFRNASNNFWTLLHAPRVRSWL